MVDNGIDGNRRTVSAEHLTHIGHILRAPVLAKREVVQGDTASKHGAHVGGLPCVEGAQVERGKTLAIREHAVEVMLIACINIFESFYGRQILKTTAVPASMQIFIWNLCYRRIIDHLQNFVESHRIVLFIASVVPLSINYVTFAGTLALLVVIIVGESLGSVVPHTIFLPCAIGQVARTAGATIDASIVPTGIIGIKCCSFAAHEFGAATKHIFTVGNNVEGPVAGHIDCHQIATAIEHFTHCATCTRREVAQVDFHQTLTITKQVIESSR